MDHILSELEKHGTNQNSFKCHLTEKRRTTRSSRSGCNGMWKPGTSAIGVYDNESRWKWNGELERVANEMEWNEWHRWCDIGQRSFVDVVERSWTSPDHTLKKGTALQRTKTEMLFTSVVSGNECSTIIPISLETHKGQLCDFQSVRLPIYR
jgi:hypothetical protein